MCQYTRMRMSGRGRVRGRGRGREIGAGEETEGERDLGLTFARVSPCLCLWCVTQRMNGRVWKRRRRKVLCGANTSRQKCCQERCRRTFKFGIAGARRLSLSLCACACVCLSVCLSVCPSVRPSVRLSGAATGWLSKKIGWQLEKMDLIFEIINSWNKHLFGL